MDMNIDLFEGVIEVLIIIILFFILFLITRYIIKKIQKHGNKFTDNKLLNPREYLPEEEISTLKQVYYLIILFLLFIFFFYNFISDKGTITFAVAEILFMLYIANTLDYSSWKNRALFFLIIPYSSFAFLFIREISLALPYIINLIHIPVIVYLMMVYYRAFKDYTEANGLGITIVLLFSIIFFSFILTMIVEGVTPLDSINMVSNAFTSNGYAVLGHSSLGKINSLFLVWSGYLISGVGTATLTTAILTKHFHKKMEKLENKIDESNQELKELIKEMNEK